jgi:hypothetical protein
MTDEAIARSGDLSAGRTSRALLAAACAAVVAVAKLPDLLLAPDQVANIMGIVVLVVNPSMDGRF